MSLIATKYEQLQGLLITTLKRFKVPGRLDLDDISSDVMLLIHDLTEQYAHIDPETSEFDALLRKAVHNLIVNRVRYHLMQCRDYRKETTCKDSEGEDLLETIESKVSSDWWWADTGTDPSAALELQERVEAVSAQLSPEARQLWSLVTEPPEGLLTFLDFYNQETGSNYSYPSWAVIGRYLGWSYKRVRWHLGNLRRVVLLVFKGANIESLLNLDLGVNCDGRPVASPKGLEQSQGPKILATAVRVWVDGEALPGLYEVKEDQDQVLLCGSRFVCLDIAVLSYRGAWCKGLDGRLVSWCTELARSVEVFEDGVSLGLCTVYEYPDQVVIVSDKVYKLVDVAWLRYERHTASSLEGKVYRW